MVQYWACVLGVLFPVSFTSTPQCMTLAFCLAECQKATDGQKEDHRISFRSLENQSISPTSSGKGSLTKAALINTSPPEKQTRWFQKKKCCSENKSWSLNGLRKNAVHRFLPPRKGNNELEHMEEAELRKSDDLESLADSLSVWYACWFIPNTWLNSPMETLWSSSQDYKPCWQTSSLHTP